MIKQFQEGRGLYIARRNDEMYGLFAVDGYYADSPIIDIASGIEQDDSDFYSIEVNGQHFFHPYGRYTNHSCDPTAYVGQGGYLFAIRELDPDEEITFNYLSSENSIKANFHCNCGAENCVGRISNA